MPCDSVPTRASARGVNPAALSASVTRRSTGVEAVQSRRETQVLPRSEIVVEEGLMRQKADQRAGLQDQYGTRDRRIRTVPRVGRLRPARQRSNVDLPAPLGPASRTTSPA